MRFLTMMSFNTQRAFLPSYTRGALGLAYPHLRQGNLKPMISSYLDLAKRQRLWRRPIPSAPREPPIVVADSEPPIGALTGVFCSSIGKVISVIDRTKPAVIRSAMNFCQPFKNDEWSFEGLADALPLEPLSLNVHFDFKSWDIRIDDMKMYFKTDGESDDEPLIIYEKRPPSLIRQKFPRPWMFPEDLMDHLTMDQRPCGGILCIEPYRGGLPPKRSRYGQDFWSFLTQGAKLWICYPPSVSRAQIGMEYRHRGGNEWFFDHYRQQLLDVPGRLEFMQNPGEIVYIPHGWWFKWICLADFNISIAKYFVDRANARSAWWALGGSLPELQDESTHGTYRRDDDDNPVDLSSGSSCTQFLDPFGLRVLLWPRWRTLLCHPTVHQQLQISAATFEDYWNRDCGPTEGKAALFALAENNACTDNYLCRRY